MSGQKSLTQVVCDADSEVVACLDQVAVRYQGEETWVPQSATFSVPRGKIVGLIGPSGSGKSSLSLTFNGVIPHSVPSVYRGSALIASREVAETPICELAVTVAMVMQDPDAQIVTTKVRDEVGYALENLCIAPEQIRERVDRALANVQLSDLADTDPWELSGGQRQRLALACALAMEPQLLVLDEPTANIDHYTGRQIYQTLVQCARQGMGILLIEHNLDPVIEHIDHIIAIDAAGTTIVQGPPHTVLYDFREALEQAGIWLPTAVQLAQLLPELAQARALSIADARAALQGNDDAISRLVQHNEATAVPLPAGDQALVVKGLHAELGHPGRYHQILHGVDLRAPAGAITAVIGANGAGKSTLLQAIVGLNSRLKAQQFELSGKSLRLGRPNSDIGYVFQNPQHQFLHGSVYEELAHPFRLQKLAPAEIKVRVERILAAFNLTHLQDKNPFLLSGGQQRRLSVASSLGEDRKVLCLDEPTFGQDEKSASVLIELLAEVTARGVAVIVSTHDMALVADHAAHVVVLDAGKVVCAGTPREVFASAAAREVGVIAPAKLQLETAETTPNVDLKIRSTIAGHIAQAPWLPRLDLGKRIGPLTSFLGVVPMLLLAIGAQRPFFNLCAMVVASVGIFFFVGRPPSVSLAIVGLIWVLAGVITWSSSFAYRFDLYGAGTQLHIGAISLDSAQWTYSSVLGTRIGATIGLVLFAGTTTRPADLLRALIKYFYLPIRIGYAGVAAIAFVRRFSAEHRTIRQARKLRGSVSRLPLLAPVGRWFGAVVPLMIGAIRHAERVSMSMDSRAFGASKQRTEMHEVRWKVADTIMLLSLWAICAGVVWILTSYGIFGALGYGFRT